MTNTPRDLPECPICGGSINAEVCVDCGRGRGAHRPKPCDGFVPSTMGSPRACARCRCTFDEHFSREDMRAYAAGIGNPGRPE